ncbi:MAG TPA: hypothetical protein VMM82_05190, partial [Spirochaetia bacterium]|nr:hypothetical protein [Spirochaetia bacterium]
LSSGFAMQATGGSRPAASAEHMLAHFWETTDVAANRPFNLHGILAAAASRLVLPMYRALYARLRTFEPDDAARRAAFDAELPWTESMEEGLRPFHRKIAEQAGSRVLDREILARRLTAFRENRQSLIELADKILGEMEQAVQILHALDYPLSFGTLGIPEADVLLPLRNVRLLRQRYSSFDLAYELGLSSFMREQGEKSLREMG